MRNRSGFASHLHKYLLIVIKLNRNTQCTSGVRREFNLRYKRKVKLRVSVWVDAWVCRLWVCILHRVFGCLISCLRWAEGLLLPLFWGASRRSPQPSPCPPASLSPEDNSDKNPSSSHRKSLGAGAHRSTVGRGGAAPRSWPPVSPQEGAQVPEGGCGKPRSSPPPAPGRPRPARVCVRCGVRVYVSHANPPSPNRPPQQFAIPYKFGNRFLKNSVTHKGDGAGGGQWHWGPQSPSH